MTPKPSPSLQSRADEGGVKASDDDWYCAGCGAPPPFSCECPTQVACLRSGGSRWKHELVPEIRKQHLFANPEVAALIGEAVKAAVEAERARCVELLNRQAKMLQMQAKQADAVGHDTSADMDRFAAQMLEGGAAAIRAEVPK